LGNQLSNWVITFDVLKLLHYSFKITKCQSIKCPSLQQTSWWHSIRNTIRS